MKPLALVFTLATVATAATAMPRAGLADAPAATDRAQPAPVPKSPTPPSPPAPPAFADALAAARASGKPLVIDFYTTWCKPCRILEEKFLPDAAVQAALGEASFVRYDAEDGPGVEPALRYQVDSFPTILVIDGAGKVVGTHVGVPAQPAELASFLDQHLPLALDEPAIVARLAAKAPGARALLAAARWYEARGRDAEALLLYERARKADAGGKLGVAATAAWRAAGLRRRADGRARWLKDSEALASKYPATPEAAAALPTLVLSGKLPAARVKQVLAARLSVVRDSADALNGFIYVALAAGDTDTALAAAQRQVELDPKLANPYDSLAEVHHYKKDRAQAVAASDKGITLSQQAPERLAMEQNRARFAGPTWAPSPDVERQRVEGERAYAALGAEGGDSVARDGTPISAEEQAMRAKQVELRAHFTARGKALGRMGEKCRSLAGGLAEAYVRIELGPADGAAKTVEVLEPGAPKALGKCLVDAARAEAWPKAIEGVRPRFVDAVQLASPTPPAAPKAPAPPPQKKNWP